MDKYFSNYKSVIFVSDGGSRRNPEFSETNQHSISKRQINPDYLCWSLEKVSCTGNFEAARYLQVKGVAVDSDLRSVTPEWVTTITPTLTGTDFVAPCITEANTTEQ